MNIALQTNHTWQRIMKWTQCAIWFLSAIVIGFGLVSQAEAQQRSETKVSISTVANVDGVVAGKPFVAAVIIDHEEGWHSQSNKAAADLVSTELIITPMEGLRIGPIVWPEPHFIKLDLDGSGVEQNIPVFEGKTIVFVPMVLDKLPADSKQVAIDMKLTVQVCTDVCLMPSTIPVQLSVPVLPTGNASKAANAEVFASWKGGEPVPDAKWSGGSATKPPASAATGNAAQPKSKFLGFIDLGSTNWLVIFVLAVIGGLLLNLTPCVLPIMPLKIMTIVQHAGTPKRALYLGLWMAAGIVVFWTGIGLPVVLFSAFGDPSRLFGIWWVTFGLGLIICVLSVGLMGVFNITLPQFIYAVNPKADSATGSFLFGVMTAVLGLPCFGFVAGALLLAAATLPKFVTLLIFFGLGVGMAAPYLVFAAWPQLLKKIPRGGPAGDLVKQVMGLLLLAVGVYFIGTALISLVANKPYMAKLLHLWAAAIVGAIAGIWLMYSGTKIAKSGLAKVVAVMVGLLFAGGGLWYAAITTASAKASKWVEYSEAAMVKARAENKVVVVDFTAEWCANCKTLRATVLDSEEVMKKFAEVGAVLLEADLTADSAAGWKLANELKQPGPPILVVYAGQDTDFWMANAYTRGVVIEQLEKAHQKMLAAKPK